MTNEFESRDIAGIRIVTANGKRLVQLTLYTRPLPPELKQNNAPDAKQFWYRVDIMTRASTADKFETVVVDLLDVELARLIQGAGEMRNALKSAELTKEPAPTEGKQ